MSVRRDAWRTVGRLQQLIREGTREALEEVCQDRVDKARAEWPRKTGATAASVGYTARDTPDGPVASIHAGTWYSRFSRFKGSTDGHLMPRHVEVIIAEGITDDVSVALDKRKRGRRRRG